MRLPEPLRVHAHRGRRRPGHAVRQLPAGVCVHQRRGESRRERMPEKGTGAGGGRMVSYAAGPAVDKLSSVATPLNSTTPVTSRDTAPHHDDVNQSRATVAQRLWGAGIGLGGLSTSLYTPEMGIHHSETVVRRQWRGAATSHPRDSTEGWGLAVYCAAVHRACKPAVHRVRPVQAAQSFCAAAGLGCGAG
jgi:hypothetical protein